MIVSAVSPLLWAGGGEGLAGRSGTSQRTRSRGYGLFRPGSLLFWLHMHRRELDQSKKRSHERDSNLGTWSYVR